MQDLDGRWAGPIFKCLTKCVKWAKKGWRGAKKGWRRAKSAYYYRRLRSIEDIYKNPRVLKYLSPQQVRARVGNTPGWRSSGLGRGSQKGRGYKLSEIGRNGEPTGRQIRWHPGGGHHGPRPYWTVNGRNGRIGGRIYQ